MKPNFALNLSHDGIVLLHRASSGWHIMGEVSLEAPDMAADLADLRARATSVSTAGLATKLIIPNSQVLYRDLPDPGSKKGARDRAIREALTGATPYDLNELIWDSSVHEGRLEIAVIARETLGEAENFAMEHRFNPVSFVALPDADQYHGEPFFGRASSADDLIGKDTEVEPDEGVLRILPKRTLPPTPDLPPEPTPDPAPGPEQGEETPPETSAAASEPVADFAFDRVIGKVRPSRAVTPEAPDASTKEDTPDVKDRAKPPSGFQSSRQSNATKEAGGSDAPRISAFPSRVLSALTPSPNAVQDDLTSAEPPVEVSTDSAETVAAKDDKAETDKDTHVEHPHVAVTSGELPVEELDAPAKPKPIRARKSDPLPEPPPMPVGSKPASVTETKLVAKPGTVVAPEKDASGMAAGATSDPQTETPPEPSAATKGIKSSAALGALKSLSAKSLTARTPGQRKPADQTKIASSMETTPVARPPSLQAQTQTSAGLEIEPLSDRAAGLDRAENTLDEAEALTVFGARRRTRAARSKSRPLGLILTALLVLALVIVALVAGLMPGDESSTSPAVEEQTGMMSPETDQLPTDIAADQTADTPSDTAVLAEAAEDMSDVEAFDEEPELTPELLEQAAVPAPPGTLAEETEPDMTALNADYAATGIWPLAPKSGSGETSQDDLNALYTASIDPEIASQDAGALPDPKRHIGDEPPRAAAQPAPLGTRYDYDEDGFIRATPEGTVLPDGTVIYAGRPTITPKPRPGSAVNEAVEAALAPVVVDENDPVRLALAAFAPKLRPESLVESNEKANLGGMTRAELGGFQPKLRPVSEQELAQEEAVIAGAAADRTAPVVKVSLIPKARPQNFDKLAAAAQAAEAAAAAAADAGTTTTSAATQVTARVPESTIPRNAPASVAQAATVKNVLNLRKVNLMGVYGSSSDRRALVRLPSGRFAKVKVGDKLDGGRVQSIGSDSLTYLKNGRAHTLEIEG